MTMLQFIAKYLPVIWNRELPKVESLVKEGRIRIYQVGPVVRIDIVPKAAGSGL